MKRKNLSGNVRLVEDHYVLRFRLPDGTDSRRELPPSMTIAEAQAELEQILAPWRGWEETGNLTFGQAVEQYIAHLRQQGRRETTLHEYERIADRLCLRHELGGIQLQRIGKNDVKQIRAQMDGTVNTTKAVLAGVVKYMRDEHDYDGPDFSEWFNRAPVKQKLEVEVYTTTEIECLARAMRTTEARVLRICAYTGMRISEVQALRWNDIDYTKSQIRVDERYNEIDGIQPPKNGRTRYVPMARQVVDSLASAVSYSDDENIFNFTRPWFQSKLDSACRATGIRRLRIHDLRHTAASLMVQRFPLSTVQEWLGHADISTTARYLHHIPKTDDAEKMSELLGS